MNAECVSSLQVVPDVIVQVTVVAVPLSRAVIVAVFDALASTLRWLIVVPPVGIGPNTRSSLLAANPVLMQAAGIAPKPESAGDDGRLAYSHFSHSSIPFESVGCVEGGSLCFPGQYQASMCSLPCRQTYRCPSTGSRTIA